MWWCGEGEESVRCVEEWRGRRGVWWCGEGEESVVCGGEVRDEEWVERDERVYGGGGEG